jgi:A/G-specific adenine glycosylase
MAQEIAQKLPAWYDVNHRELPWRTGPALIAKGEKPDPYRVWLSEIMLQQTVVETVKTYFAFFTKTWPTIHALAAADEEDILKAWAGLGYYSRARNLKKCAVQVETQHGGKFPQSIQALEALPGIGRYTASAIMAIAFGHPEPVVDGNVERVFTRLFAIETPVIKAKAQLYQLVSEALSQTRPGDFAQSCMDLGSAICTPRSPKCGLCPLSDICAGYASGEPQRFPIKLAKPLKPLRFGAAYIAVDSDGAVLLTKREDKGLLAGMTGVPTTKWNSRQDGATDLSEAPLAGDWQECGSIAHVFTHFELSLKVYRNAVGNRTEPIRRAPEDDAETARNAHGDSAAAIWTPLGNEFWWSSPADLPNEALPTVMKKAIEAAVKGATKKKT